jgi:HemY protein
MRVLLWVVAIAVLAAGFVAVSRYNTGYALFVSSPYRVELSLNLLFILLVAAFILCYFALRVISGTLRLPRQVQEYRAARRRDQARAALVETVREFLAARYARTEKAADRCMALGAEHAALAAALAARAAHELRAFDRRDAYLERAAAATGDDGVVRAITVAELLLDERRFTEALGALEALPSKHTAALRLELRAQQLARNWDQVLGLVDQLEKRGVYDADHAEQIRRFAQAERLLRHAGDARSLEATWGRIPARQKRDTRVAAAAARTFISSGMRDQAQRVIEDSLNEQWDGTLLALYPECAGGTVAGIERAEGWLKAHPQDAALLLALGQLCARQALWGKAQSYLEASLAIEPGYAAHLALARLHESLGNTDAAQRHYRQTLERAVSQLEQAAAGEKRPLPA